MFRHMIPKQDRDLVMGVRQLAQSHTNENSPAQGDKDISGFDYVMLNMLAEHNLLAPSIPEKFGGKGLSTVTTAMIIEELAVASAGVATIVSTNLHAISPILTAGTAKQQEEFLPLLTNKTPKLGAIAVAEHKPNLDFFAYPDTINIKPASLNVEDTNEDTILLKGFKNYVMNAKLAAFFTTMYSTTPHGDKKGLQVIVLPMDTPGLVVGKTQKTLGLRGCVANEIVFDNVKVNKDYLIGKKGSGFLVFMQNLDRNVAYTGAICVGVARAAYETALEASKNRMFMGKPSFEESAVSYALVDMATKINAARLSVHLACWLIDNDLEYSQAASKSKALASSVAQEVAAKAMEIVGGQAYLYGHPSEKYLRDAKMLSIVDGSEQFHRNLIAAQL